MPKLEAVAEPNRERSYFFWQFEPINLCGRDLHLSKSNMCLNMVSSVTSDTLGCASCMYHPVLGTRCRGNQFSINLALRKVSTTRSSRREIKLPDSAAKMQKVIMCSAAKFDMKIKMFLTDSQPG